MKNLSEYDLTNVDDCVNAVDDFTSSFNLPTSARIKLGSGILDLMFQYENQCREKSQECTIQFIEDYETQSKYEKKGIEIEEDCEQEIPVFCEHPLTGFPSV